MGDSPGTEEAIKRWDRYADLFTAGYDANGDIHREVLLNPVLSRLVEPIRDKKVLDAGCGEGYLSRIFAKSGAIVSAVDYSKRMLEIAQNKTAEDLNIRFYHGNCEKLDCFADKSFDLIVSNMVIQDLEHYRDAIKEMYRLLADGGTFIFSILHPCFVTPNSGWERNHEGEKLYWKIDNYFYEGVYDQVIPREQPDKILLFHRTLSSYFRAIKDAGFIVDDLIEPKPSAEMLKKYPSFKEDLRSSDFIVFKLRK